MGWGTRQNATVIIQVQSASGLKEVAELGGRDMELRKAEEERSAWLVPGRVCEKQRISGRLLTPRPSSQPYCISLGGAADMGLSEEDPPVQPGRRTTNREGGSVMTPRLQLWKGGDKRVEFEAFVLRKRIVRGFFAV